MFCVKKVSRLKRDVDMENIEEPMSNESDVVANHVTKLPEVFSVQSQQLAAAHAYYNYLLTSHERDVHFAAAAAHAHQSQHRHFLNGQRC